MSNSQAVADVRRRRKRDFVKLMGGVCHRCQYKGIDQIYHFHHADRSLKNFSISGYGVTRKLESQLAELLKCWMLCNRCHIEIDYSLNSSDGKYHSHNEVTKFHASNFTFFKGEYLKLQKRIVIENNQLKPNHKLISKGFKHKNCIQCKTKIKKTKNGLCKKCYNKNRELIDWPCVCILRANLNKSNYTRYSKQLGISDNALRGRLKRHKCECE